MRIDNARLSNRQLILLSCVVFLVLNFLPIFDYHRLLPPGADEASLYCSMYNLTTQYGIEEVRVGHILMRDDVKLFLYTTTISRSMVCTREHETTLHHFHYNDIYLNISHIDIVRIVVEINQTYGQYKHRLWYYDRSIYPELHGITRDRHGFSVEPLNIYDHYIIPYIIMKILIITMSVFIISILYSWVKYTHSF